MNVEKYFLLYYKIFDINKKGGQYYDTSEMGTTLHRQGGVKLY